MPKWVEIESKRWRIRETKKKHYPKQKPTQNPHQKRKQKHPRNIKPNWNETRWCKKIVELHLCQFCKEIKFTNEHAEEEQIGRNAFNKLKTRNQKQISKSEISTRKKLHTEGTGGETITLLFSREMSVILLRIHSKLNPEEKKSCQKMPASQLILSKDSNDDGSEKNNMKLAGETHPQRRVMCLILLLLTIHNWRIARGFCERHLFVNIINARGKIFHTTFGLRCRKRLNVVYAEAEGCHFHN